MRQLLTTLVNSLRLLFYLIIFVIIAAYTPFLLDSLGLIKRTTEWQIGFMYITLSTWSGLAIGKELYKTGKIEYGIFGRSMLFWISMVAYFINLIGNWFGLMNKYKFGDFNFLKQNLLSYVVGLTSTSSIIALAWYLLENYN